MAHPVLSAHRVKLFQVIHLGIGFIRTEIKFLLVINQPDLRVVEEAGASDDIDRKVFRFGELDGCLPFKIANRQRDFVVVSRELLSQ